MKNFIFAALLSFPIFLAGGQYVGVHGGTDYGFKTDQGNSGQKVGYEIGGVYGRDIADQVRAEAEISYREGHKRVEYSDRSEDRLFSKKYESKHTWSYMINLCYDVTQLEIYTLVPYLGIGIGYDRSVTELKIKYDNYSDSEKRRDGDFAYQGLVGFSYAVSDSVKARVQYAYHRGQQHTINHSGTVAFVKAF